MPNQFDRRSIPKRGTGMGYGGRLVGGDRGCKSGLVVHRDDNSFFRGGKGQDGGGCIPGCRHCSVLVTGH